MGVISRKKFKKPRHLCYSARLSAFWHMSSKRHHYSATTLIISRYIPCVLELICEKSGRAFLVMHRTGVGDFILIDVPKKISAISRVIDKEPKYRTGNAGNSHHNWERYPARSDDDLIVCPLTIPECDRIPDGESRLFKWKIPTDLISFITSRIHFPANVAKILRAKSRLYHL